MRTEDHNMPHNPQVVEARPVRNSQGSLVHWELASILGKIAPHDLVRPIRYSTPYEIQTQTRHSFEFGMCAVDTVFGFFGRYALISLVACNTTLSDSPRHHLFWIDSSHLHLQEEDQKKADWEKEKRPGFSLTLL
jgi:hypothetical protein